VRGLHGRSSGFSIAAIARVTAWVLATVIVVLSVVPPNGRPETGAPHALEHFAIFWATGFAAGIGWQRKHTPIGILLVIFAGVVEIAQLFVPGRHARWSDFTVDALAAVIGLVLTALPRLVRAGR
jgi:VanZ family protein